MWRWLNGPGAVFKEPLPGSTNYLNAYDANGKLLRATKSRSSSARSDDQESEPEQADISSDNIEKNIASGRPIPKEAAVDLIPFPLNRSFRSQPVLSEEFKDEIFKQVVEDDKSVRTVSADLGVEMSRVGAVVRLKSVEKRWVEEGKPLALPYARAVLEMLPKTRFASGPRQPIHESINDLPVHRHTKTQIFHPVSESRQFTRIDAGKAFSQNLLPADERVPHPELITLEKERIAGVQSGEMRRRQQQRAEEEKARYEARAKVRQEIEERDVTKVALPHSRWEFRFRDIRVEDVGRTGRDKRGVGARYGFPHEDRKRGQVKIPTKVE